MCLLLEVSYFVLGVYFVFDFSWIDRHHSNPVGTSWQWKTDDAKTVVQGAIDNHYKMINTFKGVPGVLPSRLAEGKMVFISRA